MTETQVRPGNHGHTWYIVHAYSNFEKKVAESIKEQAHAQGLDDAFSEILVPTAAAVELRRGRQAHAERNVFRALVRETLPWVIRSTRKWRVSFSHSQALFSSGAPSQMSTSPHIQQLTGQ